MTLSQRTIEAAARAIIKARQEWDDLEGPFGVYDLGYNTKEVVLRQHAVRDFRPGADAKIVARFDTHEEAMAECAILTEQHFLTAALAVDGLCLVPKEPTEQMLDAAYNAGSMENDETLVELYRAMLAAASTGDSPPTGTEG